MSTLGDFLAKFSGQKHRLGATHYFTDSYSAYARLIFPSTNHHPMEGEVARKLRELDAELRDGAQAY